MATITFEIPNLQKKEYKQVLTQFVRNYSIDELKEIQERNILYKKLSILEKEKETQKMNIDDASKYLDNLF